MRRFSVATRYVVGAFVALALSSPHAAAQTARDQVLDRYEQVFRALESCFRAPPGSQGMEVTLVFTFKRSGEIFGKPRITYSKLTGDEATQKAFIAAALKALADCTPLKFSDSLGGAIAGRPFAMRFVIAAAPQQRI